MLNSLTIIGPFATEYSLAKVNRALAYALKKQYPEVEVKLWADANHCDRLPAKAEYKKYPFLKDLYHPEIGNPDVIIYNNFPKSQYASYGLDKLPGKIKLAYLAWEETIFPKRWVDECNKYLHGLLVTSEHVRQVFRASGIQIPMFVVSEGLDIPLAKTENINIDTKNDFKFLHVSSGQYRKGVDVLLKAYLAEFSAKDNVSLVLKLFPNASYDKQLDKIIAGANSKSAEIVTIKDNSITDGQLKYLYENADAVVLPSRAEGYGLPMAEALRLKKPLITTNFSGHLDFCDATNAYLVDYTLVDSKSHLNIPGSKIAEPSQEELQKELRFIFNKSKSPEVLAKVNQGYKDSLKLTWEASADQCMQAIKSIENIKDAKNKKIAVVTTWNSLCGIADYSNHLYSPLISSFADFKIFANSDIGDRTADDEDFVIRNWQYGEKDFNKLMTAIKTYQPDIVQFQYNPAFYSVKLMLELIEKLKNLNIKTVITLHSVPESYQDITAELNLADKILIHSHVDADLLKSWGATNIELIEHGFISFKDESKEKLRARIGIKNSPIIASHGLIHDKKGILETLAAINILKERYSNILYLAINAVNPNNSTSNKVFQQIQTYINENKLANNVILISKFLDTAEIVKLLHLSDMAVLAYGDVKEGASGAVRTCIGARRPIIITNSYIFNNLNIGYRITDNQPATIATAISFLIDNQDELAKQQQIISDYNLDHNWEKASITYLSKLL